MEIYIVDTTLRDGEQAPGVIFKNQEKFEIAQMLDKLGIEEVEVGTPAMGVQEQNIIRKIATSGFNFKTISWCRALKSDINLAANCKTTAVSISFPVSVIQLDALEKSLQWVKNEIPELIKYARNYFEYVYIGLQDASRCEMKDLMEVIRLAISSGADRIRIADTVGILTPIDTMEIFTGLSAEFAGFDFEFHAHNDLGMATANAFIAIKYGAKGISGTINGIGERAGNVPVEELMMALYLKNHESKYNISYINSICNYVALSSRVELPKNKPVCGANAFTHETGIHVKSVLKNKLSYQPFDETLIGLHTNTIIIGKHSGRAAIKHFFNKLGENPSAQQIKLLHEKIHENILLCGKIPTERLLLNIYNGIRYTSKFRH